ncbi:MAG: thioesterase family protein [Sphingopyxis sp.]|uniref:acyl-CoA thioesterase n=1 Tax=Sphingopyxis sp. TaxID=1908224 RepID=UPI002AB96528|nr:thioesterase family protein [Sphingopyxis sp.]MDZ3831628.1 thioesterase family protein [Sphingopyxis sp.]
MFQTRLPLRFGHCDPAGIAYYPRCFELCDAAVEDWTAAILGVDRRRMHGDMRLGLPTVDMHATFHQPCRLGDLLDFTVDVVRVGRSSIDLDVVAACEGSARFSVRFTQVLTQLDLGRSVAWPTDFRTALNHALHKEIS